METKLQSPKVWVTGFAVIYYLGASCTFSMVDLYLLSFQASGWCFEAPTSWKGQKLKGFEPMVWC